MSIEWFRDLVICIFGVMATVAMILIAVLVVSLYRKSRNVLQSVETTSKNIQEVASTVRDQVIKPVTGLTIFVQGVLRGVNAMSKFFRKKFPDFQSAVHLL